MNQREKTLVGAVAGIAVLFGANWFVRNKVFGPIREREAKLDELTDRVTTLKKQTLRLQLAEGELARWKRSALSPDKEGPRFYQNYLRSLLMKSGIREGNFSVIAQNQNGPKRTGGANSFVTYQYNVNATGDLRSIARVLYDFHRTDAIHRIQEIDVQSNWKNDRIENFTLGCTVESLAMPGASKPKAIPVGVPPGGKSPDGKKMDAFQYFVDKNIFQPTQLVDVTRIPTGPVAQAPPADDRRLVKVSGVRGRVDSQALVLQYNGKEIVVPVGQKFSVPGMKATFIGFTEEDGVILQVGEKLGSLPFAKTLADWKEVPIRSTALAGQK